MNDLTKTLLEISGVNPAKFGTPENLIPDEQRRRRASPDPHDEKALSDNRESMLFGGEP